MSPRVYPGILWWVARLAFASAFLPTQAVAQAGLSGNALGGQAEELGWKTTNSQFDSGFNSKSALGQLEELTGSKVERSSPAPAPVQPAAHKISRSVQMRNDFNQEIAGMLAEALIGSLFADNSAAEQAEAEAAAALAAAQAAAEAEAFRVQQELAKKARIRMAQHYRAEWDDRDAEVGSRLGGAFDVSGGTAFFGRPANPDADTVAAILGQDVGGGPPGPSDRSAASDPDSSVVDLRGSSMIVQPRSQVTTAGVGPTKASHPVRPPSPSGPAWVYDLSGPDESSSPGHTPSSLQGLVAYFGPWLGRWYWETLAQGTATATAWGIVKNVPGQKYYKALYDAHEKRVSLGEAMNEVVNDILEPTFSGITSGARVLGRGDTGGGEFAESYNDSIGHSFGTAKVKIYETIFGEHAGHVDAPDLGELEPVGIEGGVPVLSNVASAQSLHLRASLLKAGR